MKRKQYVAKMLKRAALIIVNTFLIVEMSACSFESKDGDATEEMIAESQTTADANKEADPQETADANKEADPQDTAATNSEAASPETEELEYVEEDIPQGDPVIGIVDKYEDDLIIIRDGDDQDLVYYFSTQNAQVEEGDFPIVAGDVVAITYRGVMGDEGNPGKAVKVVRFP